MNIIKAGDKTIPLQEVHCQTCRKRSKLEIEELVQISQEKSMYEFFCPRCGASGIVRWTQLDELVKLEMMRGWLAKMRRSST